MNILFLTSTYLPNPSANGINSKSIIEELKKRGHQVTCISVQRNGETDVEIIHDTGIHRLPPSRYSQLIEKHANKKLLTAMLRITRSVKLIWLLHDFPNHDPQQAKRIRQKAQNLHFQKHFDLVIGVHKPYSNIAALLEFKRHNPDVPCIAYYLDLTNSHLKPKLMPQPIYEWLCFKADMRIFAALDLVLIAKKGERVYKSGKYDIVRRKIEYVDFPTLVISDKNYDNPRIDDDQSAGSSISLVFAGTLDRQYRNPEYLFKCMQAASKNLGNIEFHIYGRGNCDDIIDTYAGTASLKIIKHGLVSHETVVQALNSADFLVNISNTIEDAVPSKIFELFSTGKPVINVVFLKNDPTRAYFDKYPVSFCLEGWQPIGNQPGKLAEFMQKNIGMVIDSGLIEESFRANKPEYIVDLIEKTQFLSNSSSGGI